MPKAASNPFTHSHLVLNDGAVAFLCSADKDQWPWLALHPFDPIVVQTINYWAASGVSAARGTADPTKWTALTQTEWTCGAKGAGHATHGIAEASRDDGEHGYRLIFFDEKGALVYRMSGTGVVFQNRDFEAWRNKAKQELAAVPDIRDFRYAPADTVGVKTQSECFVSSLIEGNTPSSLALITRENGFSPGHPYLGGSGDHVNSAHLVEVGRQFATLIRSKQLLCTGGEMQFTRYVELGSPFRIDLADDLRSQNAISMIVQQADRVCATIVLRFE